MTDYPVDESKNPTKDLYYVEFERAGEKNTFTLFQRNFIFSEEDLSQLLSQPNITESEKFWSRQSREGHPYNLYTATFGADGCIPDKKWVCWMVDCLNWGVSFKKFIDAEFKQE